MVFGAVGTFCKIRTYAERKRSRPSGSVPPALKTSPRARTSLEVTQPGTFSSSSSLSSGGQVKKGESRGAPSVAPRKASSPSTRPRSSERGGRVSGRSSVARERAYVSLAPSGAAKGRLLVRSGCPCPCRFLGCLSPLIAAHSSTR